MSAHKNGKKRAFRPDLLIEHIAGGAQSLGQELSEESVRKCARLLCELDRWNSRMNLTAIRAPADMVGGHLLDSLVVRPLIRGKSLIDLFPLLQAN